MLKYTCCLLSLYIITTTTNAQEHKWSKSIGNTKHTHTSGMAKDTMGNIIIVGNYLGDIVNIASGISLPVSDTNDAFIIKLDKEGIPLWAKAFGGTGIQNAMDVTSDQNSNIIIVGNFTDSINLGGSTLKSNGAEDLFVAKFDESGNHLWSKSFGAVSSEMAWKVKSNNAGKIYFTGYFYGSLNFGNGILTSSGDNDVFLVQFDEDGNAIWSKEFGSTSSQRPTGLAIDKDNNILLTGEFYDSINFGLGDLTSMGYKDIFLSKFNASGSPIWAKSYGGISSQEQPSLTTDNDNNIILTGIFSGDMSFGDTSIFGNNSDIFLVKFNSNGEPTWVKSFGGQGNQYSSGITTDHNNKIYLTGHFANAVNFGGGILQSDGWFDVFLAKFDSDGEYIWSNRYGNAGIQYSNSIVTDERGNFFASGNFSGIINFGGQNLIGGSSPYRNIYLVRFDSYLPEILLKEGENSIPNEGSYEYGNVIVGYTSNSIEFVIENTGTGELTLSGNPRIKISGTNADDFIIDQTTTTNTIGAGGSTAFKIYFKPLATGEREAIITIENDDTDENPFVFYITGLGISNAEINLKQGNNIISNESGFDFGNVPEGENKTVTFTIENKGETPLELLGNPKITIGGVNKEEFLVDETSTAATVNGNDSTTFTITFSPLSLGVKNAYVLIANNDLDENPYSFSLIGNNTLSSYDGIKMCEEISIFPNPSNGKFQVLIPDLKNKELEITISNLTGQQVFYFKVQYPLPNYIVDISSCSKGMYFMNLKYDNKVKNSRLIVN